MHHLWTGQDFGDRLPSEVFRDHFLTCFIADPVGMQLRHDIGIDNIAWECDYPHSDSSWPDGARGAGRGGRRRRAPTTSSTRSPTRTPCAGTPTTRSPTSPRRRRPSPRCGPRRPATTSHPLLRQGPLRAHRQGRRPRQAGPPRPPPDGYLPAGDGATVSLVAGVAASEEVRWGRSCWFTGSRTAAWCWNRTEADLVAAAMTSAPSTCPLTGLDDDAAAVRPSSRRLGSACRARGPLLRRAGDLARLLRSP